MREEIEATVGGERRARDDGRLRALEQILTQNRREIERHRRDARRAIAAFGLDPSHRWLAAARIERALQAIARNLQPTCDGAHLVHERHYGVVEILAALQSLANELESFGEQVDLADGVVERDTQTRFPDRMLGELVGETDDRFTTFLQEHLEQIE